MEFRLNFDVFGMEEASGNIGEYQELPKTSK